VPSYRKPEDLYAGDGLRKKCWRGAAFADWDDDGDTDVYLQAMNDTGMLLRNDVEKGPDRRWVRLSLDQGGKNHDAIGATVYVRAEGLPEQMFPIYRCHSFLGTDDPRLLVGIGKADRASVSVVWPGPDRKRTEHVDLKAGAHHVLRIDGTSGPAAPK
jgi:enediyne biosynthesis protein E4